MQIELPTIYVKIKDVYCAMLQNFDIDPVELIGVLRNLEMFGEDEEEE